MSKEKWKDIGVTIFVVVFMSLLIGGTIASVVIMFVEMAKKASAGPDISYMDVNLDGQVDDMDARLVYEVINSGNIPTPDLMNRCDIDKDGFITETDAFLIHREVFK